MNDNVNYRNSSEISVGTQSAPDSASNNKSIHTFFSDFINIKETSVDDIVQFYYKWGIYIEHNELIIPSLLIDAFSKTHSIYAPIIKKILDGKYKELTEKEINLFNTNLGKIQLKIVSPTLSKPIEKYSAIFCFYSDGKLDMEVNLKMIGHPSLAEKEARIIGTLKGKMPLSVKLTPIDDTLLGYLSKQSGIELLDEFRDKWIVESTNLNIAKGTNEIKLYIEDVMKREQKEKIEEVYAAYSHAQSLEEILVLKLWSYFSLPTSQKHKKLCIVCYKPVSRPNSKHCGSKICIKRIKSLKNKRYYKTTK
jgi:hypothetical protein